MELTVEDDALVLRGEKKVEAQTEEEGCYRRERAYGWFQRVIPLPDGVDVDKVEATCAKGGFDHPGPEGGDREAPWAAFADHWSRARHGTGAA